MASFDHPSVIASFHINFISIKIFVQFFAARGAKDAQNAYADCQQLTTDDEINDLIEQKFGAMRTSIIKASDIVSTAHTHFTKTDETQKIQRAILEMQYEHKSRGVVLLREQKDLALKSTDKCAGLSEAVTVMKTIEKATISDLMDTWINSALDFEFPRFADLLMPKPAYHQDLLTHYCLTANTVFIQSQFDAYTKLESAGKEASALVIRNIQTSALKSHLLGSVHAYVAQATAEINKLFLCPQTRGESDCLDDESCANLVRGYYKKNEEEVKEIYMYCLYNLKSVSNFFQIIQFTAQQNIEVC